MNVFFNGISCEVQEGQTVLEAARANGIYIPSLCFHHKTGPAGKCRACLAEIEGMRGLQTTCTITVKNGMKISSKKLISAFINYWHNVKKLIKKKLIKVPGPKCQRNWPSKSG